MSSANSIVTIPPILERLARFLNRSSLLACSLSNHAWYALFTPYFWRHLVLITNKEIDFSLRPASKAIVSKNAHHVRTIICRYPQIFAMLGPDCTLLRSLHFAQSMNWDEYRPTRHAEFMTRILKQNTHLESFTTSSFPFTNEVDTKELMDALSPFPSPAFTFSSGLVHLKTLKLTSMRHGICQPEALVVLLKLVPIQVSSLTLSTGARAMYNAKDFQSRLAKDSQFRERMDMTRMTLADPLLQDTLISHLALPDCNLQGFEASILFPFLRRCPRLESFHLPDILPAQVHALKTTLTESCPLLQGLALESGVMDQEPYFTSLLSGMKRLQSLHLDCTQGMGNLSSSMLLDIACLTLERIEFWNCQPGPSSFFLQRILCTCPRLRSLIVMDSRRLMARLRESDRAVLSLDEQTVGIEARDAVLEPWVCKDLEHLQVVIKNVPRPDLSPSLIDGPPPILFNSTIPPGTPHATMTVPTDSLKVRMTLARAQSHSFQQRLFFQLGSLHNLQTLVLSPHFCCDVLPTPQFQELDFTNTVPPAGPTRTLHPNQHGCLDFTIASGLSHLGGLKQLRILDLRRMGHVIGAQELEWIEGHWPKLKELHGLENTLSIENEAEKWTALNEKEGKGLLYFKQRKGLFSLGGAGTGGRGGSRWGQWIKTRVDSYANIKALEQLKARRPTIVFS